MSQPCALGRPAASSTPLIFCVRLHCGHFASEKRVCLVSGLLFGSLFFFSAVRSTRSSIITVLRLMSSALASFRRKYSPQDSQRLFCYPCRLDLARHLLLHRSWAFAWPASGFPGDAPSRFLASVWLRWRHRFSDGPSVCAPLIVGKSLRNLWTRRAYAAVYVRSSLPVLWPCRIPTAVSSGSVWCLIGRAGGVAALSRVCSCPAVEPRRPQLRSVASLCPADKGGCARRADVFLGAAHCFLGATSKSFAARPRVSRALRLSPLHTSVSQHSGTVHHSAWPTSCCAAPAPASGPAVLLRLPTPTVVAASAPALHTAPSPAVWWSAPAPIANYVAPAPSITLLRVFGWPHRSCASGMPRHDSACNGVASVPLVAHIVPLYSRLLPSRTSRFCWEAWPSSLGCILMLSCSSGTTQTLTMELLAVGYYSDAGLIGFTSGPLTEMCTTVSQISPLFSNLLLSAVPALWKVSNGKNQFPSKFHGAKENTSTGLPQFEVKPQGVRTLCCSSACCCRLRKAEKSICSKKCRKSLICAMFSGGCATSRCSQPWAYTGVYVIASNGFWKRRSRLSTTRLAPLTAVCILPTAFIRFQAKRSITTFKKFGKIRPDSDVALARWIIWRVSLCLRIQCRRVVFLQCQLIWC